MSSIRLTKLSRASLAGAVLLIGACLLLSVACARDEPELSQKTDLSQDPDTLRKEYQLSMYLAREGYNFYKEWEKTRDTTNIPLLRAVTSFYRAALMADSTLYQVHLLISYPLNASGDNQGAIAACEKFIELHGDKPTDQYCWLGRMYCESGQMEKALEAFRKQILLDPASEPFYSDTRFYIEACDFPPEVIEEVLSLSKVHKVSKK